jgi:hypothetical protein
MVIILDTPLTKYYSIIKNLNYEDTVYFLCSKNTIAHIIQILIDRGVNYVFLDLPISEWNKYKIREEYKGDL